MNLPSLKPPKLPPEEHLRRLLLQKEGLNSWEPGPEKQHMLIWLEARIVQQQQAVAVAKGQRS